MRTVQEHVRLALESSRTADTLTVWAWRNDKLAHPEPLDIADWSLEDDGNDNVKVNQRCSFTVLDPDGSLGAWKFDDPLGTGGTRLQVIWNVGDNGSINYNWYRIQDNDPAEVVEWRRIFEAGLEEPDSEVKPNYRDVPLVKAAVKLTGVDITDYVDTDKLEAPESPPAGATYISEFRRFTQDYFPTVVDAGVVDGVVPPNTVYEKERLENCQDLLTRINAKYRMGGDGECHIYRTNTAPVLRIEPGRGLISVARRQSSKGLKNRWVVEGKDAVTGFPVTAAVQLDAGALRYGGPHGKAQEFYTSEMITSTTQAVAYADVMRGEALNKLSIDLDVETLPRPELQCGDRVEIGYPITGKVIYLKGMIVRLKSAGNPIPTGTTLTVRCNYTDVMVALGTTPWAKYLTGNKPPLPWD